LDVKTTAVFGRVHQGRNLPSAIALWRVNVCVASEAYIIFSGGTPVDPRLPPVPSLTVMKGNNMTVLEMEHEVVDFVTLSSTPWNSGTTPR